MAKYTISSDYGSVFGMNVHARSITVKGFNWPTGEERTRTFTDCPAASEIVSWMGENFDRRITRPTSRDARGSTSARR